MSDAPLSIGMEDRYERLQMIPWWDQARISAARIMVVGAGALGNEVIKNLALLGTGLIVIVDFDRIEASNLSRSVLFRDRDCGGFKAELAAAAARELNPGVRSIPLIGRFPEDLGAGLVQAMDVVIGCVDNREARLWINRICWRMGRPWIDGGIQEISGVAKVFAPPGHPAHVPGRGCYECTMTENDYRLMQLRYSCPLLSREEILQGRTPTAPTISSIIGGLQVQECLKLLHGLPAATGTGLVFNGNANRFYQTAYPERLDCLSHESATPVVVTGASSRSVTAAQLIARASDFAATRGNAGGADPAADSPPALLLDRDFAVAWNCDACLRSTPLNRPLHQVRSREAKCPDCHQDRRPVMVHEIPADGPLANQPLDRIGIPPFECVPVRISMGQTVWMLMDGDRPQWLEQNQQPAGSSSAGADQFPVAIPSGQADDGVTQP